MSSAWFDICTSESAGASSGVDIALGWEVSKDDARRGLGFDAEEGATSNAYGIDDFDELCERSVKLATDVELFRGSDGGYYVYVVGCGFAPTVGELEAACHTACGDDVDRVARAFGATGPARLLIRTHESP